MKKQVGFALLVLGMLPFAAMIAGWAALKTRGYTVVLAPAAETILALLLVAGFVCFGTGLYLIAKRPKSQAR